MVRYLGISHPFSTIKLNGEAFEYVMLGHMVPGYITASYDLKPQMPQVASMGFSADIIIWDFEARKIMQRLILHKVFQDNK